MGISMKMPPKSVTWLVGQSATMGVAGEDEAADVAGADAEAAPDAEDAGAEVDAAPDAAPS